MSSATLTTAGILLITVVAVAYGGLTLLTHLARRRAGYLDNPVRRGLWTAGHAHAGVLVLFTLAVLPYIDQADASDGTRTLIRSLLVAAPILMPLGFFLSVARPQDTRPNKLIWLTVAGGACLVVGALLLGITLL
ncbi:hypothetical protein [Micromonospora globbae]|uniref:Integral membrane protein n=1 Tax=Micromonospora globbae TaxID=1894969 RepID=A0A420F3Q9_9ACTN|nr:hypothetical protein [Micromonospora globbae]RKF27568.1 hypothetical protein D7I43_11050 [Micromonospora globbae]WTF86310.1 hypothetical protein OH732_01445 [Micromonospora globbae]